MTRPNSDDEISLGIGGIKPPTGLRFEKKAFILIGLPASGKSTISNRIADEYGAYVVDSDHAKRKFPEYLAEYGAAVLHAESTMVTFGSEESNSMNEPNVFAVCLANNANVVIPKVGSNTASILALRNLLTDYSYEVHFTLVKIDRLHATRRALLRFRSTNRYVPISLIFDEYGNEPILSYYYIKDDCEWASIGVLSTEGATPLFVSGTKNNPAFIYK